MPVCLALTGRCARVVMQRLAKVFAVLVAHDGELEIDRFDAVELCCSVGDSLLDFCLERAARNREGDQNANDPVPQDRDTTDHAEVDD